MSDDRPQYGEYASPEEQRRRAGLPPLDPATADLPPAGFGPVHVPGRAAEASPSSTPAPRPRGVDRIVTIALLAYGLVNVVMSAIAYLDLPGVMNRYLEIFGIEGEFTNLDQGRLWGGIAAAVLVAGYALTVWLSVRRLRAPKPSWWVPIVGAVVTSFAVSLCLMVPMLGDPAFASILQGAGS
ncbi:DUF6264 family protein [Microbacterium tumbae]